MKILIDMDGIVCNTLPVWLKRIAEKSKFQIVAQVEDIKVWDMLKCPPLDKADPKLVFDILQERDFIRDLPPIFGAVEGVKSLIDAGHEVYLVTARHGPVSMPDTLDWVRKHMPFINAEKQTIFCYEKHLIPADILIDDKAETLVKYDETHPEAALLSIRYPYNEHLDPGRFKIFGSKSYLDHTLTWGQIVGYIQSLAEQRERQEAAKGRGIIGRGGVFGAGFHPMGDPNLVLTGDRG